ncbi:response regulator [Shewanella avicenniae]|uniref:Response regulator n=1 Tax=Shewanella avicenniae TaxID=2814294 RepID=A0ABX7QPC8_9GAMM|nr:response regulator [Shewanella avicenniae]QSX33331.1 response regulator [Shewanella avicenniae]
MEQQAYKQVTLFIVEDDDIDFMAVQRCMQQLRLLNPIVRARDGVEALEMLRAQQVEAPYLILLDLNMPRMNGLEFLEQIRHDPIISLAVVFVLTTSNADEDKLQAYRQHVAGYVVKNNLQNGFLNLFDMLEHYWRIVELPNQ